MSMIFFIPLSIIALWESQIARTRSERIRAYFDGPIGEEEEDPKVLDPACDEDDGGEISKVKFEDLVKVFPEYVTLSVACRPR